MPINQPFSMRAMPPVVRGLVIANAVMFLAQIFFGPQVTQLFGLSPARVINQFWIWQLGTYMFLHGGLFHVLLNMFILWSFGRELEMRWGSGGFLWYFLVCGWGAAVFNVILSPDQVAPSIGASGAIYGLLMAFAFLFPNTVVYMYFLVPIKIKYLVLILGGIEFFMGTSMSPSGIANWAHLGGLLTGFLYLKSGNMNRAWDNFWQKFQRRRPIPKKVRRASARPRPSRKGASVSSVPIHELSQEVDRILDKILKKGVKSLTTEERDLMDRYSKMKK